MQKDINICDLSVIIPVYNSDLYISQNITRLKAFLTDNKLKYEIILIDDGSSDNTCAILESEKSPNIHVLHNEKNRGKFYSIKRGILKSSGRCCIFTDADLPYELNTMLVMEKLVNFRQFHIVIGDRFLPGSSDLVGRSVFRRMTTRIFSFIVRSMIAGGLFDTQCGLKAFRSDVAKIVFELIVDSGFAGDLELLYLGLKYNLEIKKVPVVHNASNPSSVNILIDPLRIAFRLCMLKYYWETGRYHSDLLSEISKNSHMKYLEEIDS